MRELFRRGAIAVAAGIVGTAIGWSSTAWAQGEPPGRVGRLAFTEGTVSFHDDKQSGWTRAVVNTPLTTGDAIWTEPNARSELSLPGTRIRMEGATEFDMLALDDSQTRMQLAQGRIDVRTFTMDTGQPYQIVTPRGTISLQKQGDYYVEAGSTQDPTRLGVRSGAAQIQDLNGQVLAVRPGEVGEVLGDASAPQLRAIQTAPPAPPAYWASRDRQVSYDQPPQYLSADYTGYEDLNVNGSWINDGSYGEVWVPRSVPSGWAPYRSGHWSYVRPWGWTWIDDQPWGFAPYHYGRWANSGGRWVWVPPQREARPVYAPALVAFVGGVELALSLGNQSAAPVGWFPLGPREVYVPPYTTNRDYYQRINRAAQIQDQVLQDRWQRAQRHEAFVAGQNSVLMNQRFATVVPTTAFVRSQPVMSAALQVAPDKIAAAPVAPASAPPAPTASVAAVAPATAPAGSPPAAATAPATRDLKSTTAPAAQPAAPVDPKAQADAKAKAEAEVKAANVPVANTAVAGMATLAKPAATATPAAPGPKIATVQPQAPTADKTRQAVPALAPRQGAAPPELKGTTTAVPAQPAKPGEPTRSQPAQQQASPQPQAAPSAAPQVAPRPAAPAPAPQQQAKPEAAKPAEPPKPQQAAPQPHAVPAPAPAPQQQARPEAPKPAEPPRPQPAQQAAPQPQHPQPPQAQAPQPQHPQPPQAQAPNQAQAPAPQPHPAPQPAPAPQQKPNDKKDEKK